MTEFINGSLENILGKDGAKEKIDTGQLGQIRQNVAVLIDSGKLPTELAEKLAKIKATEIIEKEEKETLDNVREDELIKKEGDLINFGLDENSKPVKMEIFRPERKRWSPKFYPTKDGRFFDVGFIADDGQEFIDPVNCQRTNDDNLDDLAILEAIKIEQGKLEKHLKEIEERRYRPPEKREEFRETEDSVSNMRKMAKQINRQLETGRGILIVEGEAGTGKNWMLDHIAHLTNRPVFRFTCDASKESPDLKYILEFITDEKGARTVRISSTVIEALETEGAILELDEINTLRPDVAKSLNSLFDADRAIYFGEDNLKVKAAEDVILIGLMNPSNYAGVKPLPETIKSRSRIMVVDYPRLYSEDENGDSVLLSSEAEIVYQYLPELKDLGQNEFKILWNKVVNGKENKIADHLLTQNCQARISQLKMLIQVADKIRTAYRQYQSEGSGTLVDYNFTLRETVDCAVELASLPTYTEDDAKKVVVEIFIPKLDTPEERKNSESLIREI